MSDLQFPLILQGIRLRGADLGQILAQGWVDEQVGQEQGTLFFLSWLHSLKTDLDRLDLAMDGHIGPRIGPNGDLRWVPTSPAGEQRAKASGAFDETAEDLLPLPPAIEVNHGQGD
jgi:hypothetical protein